MDVEDCVCVKDFETLANKKLSEGALGFYNGGGTDEQTLKENCAAFKRWRFRPRILRNVSQVDMTSSVLGRPIQFPVCVAPTSMIETTTDVQINSAKAACSLGIGFTLSSLATTSIEEIATQVPSLLRWFQVYIFKDKNVTKSLIQLAEKNGYCALILTIDTPVVGMRYRDLRNKFSFPFRVVMKNIEMISGNVKKYENSGHAEQVDSLIYPQLTWEDVDWLRTFTRLPIIVKGILTAEAALEAVQHGVDGILVSNHGGRQLDGVFATINALPEVVKAVDGKCEVYIDGGVRNGGDVAKAIALGAKAVFIGRPMIWGIACDGEAGGRRVLEILRDEFEMTMKLLGVRSIEELQSTPNLVVHDSKAFSKL